MLMPTAQKIDDYNVTFYPLDALKVMCLDKKVAALVSPVMKIINPDEMDKEVNFAEIGGILSDALNSLTDDALISLVTESLRGCTITAPNQAPVQIDSSSQIGELFKGAVDTLYKVVFESWRYNKLTPFVLLQRIGLKVPKIDSSSEEKEPQRSGGLKLER